MRPYHFLIRLYIICLAGLPVVCPLPSAFAASSETQLPQTRVLMFYVDGLRPDNVDQMAAEHQLPHIEDLFYKNGLRLSNAFTAFPSNTLVSNGLFMTGRWPENSGLKCQALFERFEVPGQRHLQFITDWIGRRQTYPRYFNLLTQTDVAPILLKKNKIPTLYDYLGERFHGTVLPINPHAAPLAWPHVAVNTVPHFYKVTQEAPDEIDRLNGEYAKRYMLADNRADVFMIWFPGLDEAQHASKMGQFGEVRDRLKAVDQSIGDILHGFQNGMNPAQDRLITILFSDHGAYGGREGHYNQPFHIARDFFYQKLKLNVRGPDFSLTFPGTNPKSYAFIDNMGRGQTKIYLPYRDGMGADWSRRNAFYDLTHYSRGPNREPVNLITAVSGINLNGRNTFPGKTSDFPAELLFVKISPEMLYLRRFDGTEALILIRTAEGQETYRYVPISGFDQTQDGKVSYQETSEGDALGYLQDPGFGVAPENRGHFMAAFHDSTEWLQASYTTTYPDAVVSLAKLFRWNPRFAVAEQSRDPDMVLSAAPGWNFRIEDLPSADHGSLRADSVRITFMISGPGLKKGVLDTPHRIIQIPPTLFELLEMPLENHFDEPPMRDIYEIQQ